MRHGLAGNVVASGGIATWMIGRQIFSQAAGPRDCRTCEALKAPGLSGNLIDRFPRPPACLLLGNPLVLQDDQIGRKAERLLWWNT